MKRLARRAAAVGGAAAAAYVGGSYLLARVVARRLISPTGFGPAPARHEDLLAALESSATVVANLKHRGSARLPVELSATFASPGEPETRPTIIFLHGKGGDASEWESDALRALRLGYNVLLPDLRGHGRSGGTFFTLGFLEKEDLALTRRRGAGRLRRRSGASRHPLLLGGIVGGARVRGPSIGCARDLARVAVREAPRDGAALPLARDPPAALAPRPDLPLGDRPFAGGDPRGARRPPRRGGGLDPWIRFAPPRG